MAKFNLNLSDTAYSDVSDVAGRLDISMADVIREALSLLLWIIREIDAGNRILIQRGDQVTEVVVPELERLRDPPSPRRSRPARPDLAPSN